MLPKQPVSVLPIPSNVDIIPFMRDVQNMARVADRVLTQMLAANNGQGLAFTNPYIPRGVPANEDIPQWDTSVTPAAYVPKSLNDIVGFGFQRVSTESAFTTPTIPSFGYANDTGVYYVYNLVDAAWQKVGIVLP